MRNQVSVKHERSQQGRRRGVKSSTTRFDLRRQVERCCPCPTVVSSCFFFLLPRKIANQDDRYIHKVAKSVFSQGVKQKITFIETACEMRKTCQVHVRRREKEVDGSPWMRVNFPHCISVLINMKARIGNKWQVIIERARSSQAPSFFSCCFFSSFFSFHHPHTNCPVSSKIYICNVSNTTPHHPLCFLYHSHRALSFLCVYPLSLITLSPPYL